MHSDANVDLTQGITGSRHELLPCNSQADAAVRSLEQRGSKVILKIPDAPAHSRLLNIQECRRLAKAPLLGSRDKVLDMAQPDHNGANLLQVFEPQIRSRRFHDYEDKRFHTS